MLRSLAAHANICSRCCQLLDLAVGQLVLVVFIGQGIEPLPDLLQALGIDRSLLQVMLYQPRQQPCAVAAGLLTGQAMMQQLDVITALQCSQAHRRIFIVTGNRR